jgi:RNA polymerase-binding transcription factor DksA
MAKSKKKPAKPAKKASSKPKAAAKPAKKKPAPKPSKKAKPAQKVVAKKVAKVAPKKVEKKAVASKVEVKTPVIKKAEAPSPPKKMEGKMAMAPPKVAPQLNIFPQLTQRPVAHKPAKPSTVDDRTRYSDDELKEFESLINKKLEKAREEFRILKDTLNRNNDEGTDATSGGNTKVLEDGAETAEKENLSQLAARQQKYIQNLENALIRIKNGTYGICSVTGKLISKERLIAVPHTTQSIEAKMMKQD